MTSKHFVRMTYTHPEQTTRQVVENGAVLTVRIPSHPTRPARPWEFNSWLEETPESPANRQK